MDDTRALRFLLPPLDYLLASGGDTRLHLEPVTLLNGYGCRPFPRPEALTFASSTATSISDRAFAEARAMYDTLIDSAVGTLGDYCFTRKVERLRHQLRAALGLEGMGCEVILSPSGTDSALHATAIAQSVLGRPLVSVVVASDETGSGTAFAAAGRHFSSITPFGAAVTKGELIAGMEAELRTIGVPLRAPDGALRRPADIDEETVRAVSAQVGEGRYVVLHVMDNSKLGCRAPGPECVHEITARWHGSVQVVVDACQLRLSRRRIRAHLAAGHVMQITGSKFFTGPPFSGALLVPPVVAERIERSAEIPAGLGDYTARASWPDTWAGVQNGLSDRINVGEFLRWVAAVAEMHSYFAVPETYRRYALARFAAAMPALIARGGTLELLPDYSRSFRADPENDEFTARTIFPFLLHRNGTPLSFADATVVYRALNRDLTPLLPHIEGADERSLLAQLCHIGQPVAVQDASGRTAGALRISAGARVVSQTWRPGDSHGTGERLQRQLDQVGTIVDKIHLILRNFDQLVQHRM
jgi:hypothetical protein